MASFLENLNSSDNDGFGPWGLDFLRALNKSDLASLDANSDSSIFSKFDLDESETFIQYISLDHIPKIYLEQALMSGPFDKKNNMEVSYVLHVNDPTEASLLVARQMNPNIVFLEFSRNLPLPAIQLAVEQARDLKLNIVLFLKEVDQRMDLLKTDAEYFACDVDQAMEWEKLNILQPAFFEALGIPRKLYAMKIVSPRLNFGHNAVLRRLF